MQIVLSPDPILRQVCEEVELGDKQMKRLAKQMAKTMYKASGVGLAAPQVGILKRIVVIDTEYTQEDEEGNSVKKNPLVFINPKIVDHSEETVMGSEGCLSVPGISCNIERWEWVKVQCYDEDFNQVVREGDGLFGRCMQHELDHLDGKTLFERLDPVARLKALELYNQALEQGAKPGDC